MSNAETGGPSAAERGDTDTSRTSGTDTEAPSRNDSGAPESSDTQESGIPEVMSTEIRPDAQPSFKLRLGGENSSNTADAAAGTYADKRHAVEAVDAAGIDEARERIAHNDTGATDNDAEAEADQSTPEDIETRLNERTDEYEIVLDRLDRLYEAGGRQDYSQAPDLLRVPEDYLDACVDIGRARAEVLKLYAEERLAKGELEDGDGWATGAEKSIARAKVLHKLRSGETLSDSEEASVRDSLLRLGARSKLRLENDPLESRRTNSESSETGTDSDGDADEEAPDTGGGPDGPHGPEGNPPGGGGNEGGGEPPPRGPDGGPEPDPAEDPPNGEHGPADTNAERNQAEGPSPEDLTDFERRVLEELERRQEEMTEQERIAQSGSRRRRGAELFAHRWQLERDGISPTHETLDRIAARSAGDGRQVLNKWYGRLWGNRGKFGKTMVAAAATVAAVGTVFLSPLAIVGTALAGSVPAAEITGKLFRNSAQEFGRQAIETMECRTAARRARRRQDEE